MTFWPLFMFKLGIFQTLLNEGWKQHRFEPFHEGVHICTLWAEETTLALLKYEPGASVPRHRHTGTELILVLEGSQSDEQATYSEGSVILNPVGSEHTVWSEQGCVILIHWEKPVEFINAFDETIL